MTRTLVVGDIHGCFDELLLLLERVKLSASDRVIGVGDLIVKGPRNREVLDLFSGDPRFSAVIGNHDLAILNFWQGRIDKLKKSQRRTCLELEGNKHEYCAYLSSLPFIIDLGSHAVIHAGVRPGKKLNQQAPEDLTELRTLGSNPTSRKGTPWYERYDGEKVILFGHWPSPKPRISARAIGLDTGCVYGNRLTGYIVETQEFVDVPAQKIYDPPRRSFYKNQ
jgi:serine/threonine protein phosphatase 1